MAQLLTDAKVCEVEPPLGTCIRMSLKGRRGRALTCIAHEPGGYATPPDIEASIAPIEGSSEGFVVVDGSIAGFGLIREPVKLVVQEGKVTEISGGTEARWLKDTLEQAKHPNVYKIAELGIGLNPEAKLIGTILEDRRCSGSCAYSHRIHLRRNLESSFEYR
jgi:leucyl aminopeptidase (aminopeptidase T)